MILPPLLALVLTLALVGFLTWVVITYVPMPDLFKRLIVIVVVIVVIVWLVRYLGLLA